MRTVRGPTRLSLSCRSKRKLTTMRSQCFAGVPLAASRDVNLIGLAWVLPGLLLPLVLAKVFAMFSDPYKVFFLASAVMMALQSPILLCVRPSRTGAASSGAAGDGEGSPARKPSSLPDWPEQESPDADAKVPLLAGSE